MDDFQKLINFENLYNSCRVSLRGKGKTISAAKFSTMALENISLMKYEIKNHLYKILPYYEFTISRPKKRIIKAGSFRDKVLQHCLCDYVLLPKMNDIFIRGNFAGQIGKGTLFGLDSLSEDLKSFYSEYGADGYILKCDITKFFYSIDHDVIKKEIRKYFTDEEIRWICDLFIDSVDGDGLPLGNQCSQVFALIFLTGLDYYIKEELGCKYYGRYMDDFYLLSNDKEYLQECLKKVIDFLSGLKLTLNNKTEIVPMSKGIRFLGFHTYLTPQGEVIRKLTGENKRGIKKRILTNYKLLQSGKIERKEYIEKYRSWRNHASHGNCNKLIYEMDMFAMGFINEDNPEIRIIVAGGRDFNDYNLVFSELQKFIKEHKDKVITIVSGCANGADSLGEKFAIENCVNLVRFPAQWNKYGNSAGYIRNNTMVDYISETDCLVFAFWNGKSHGTKHMIKLAKKKGIPVKVFMY